MLQSKRFYEIDTLKGIAVILMVIFHFFYLVSKMEIKDINTRCGPLYASAKTAHCLFIFLVGVNLAISYKKFKEKNREDFENDKNKYYSKYLSKTFKRIAVLVVAAASVSILSYLAFKNLYVKFGIFHFIAAAVLLTTPIVGSKYLSLTLSAIIGLLYTIFNSGKMRNFTSIACHKSPIFCFITGIFNTKFSSLDHFSLVPYLGLVAFGIFIGNTLYTDKERLFLKKEDSKKIDELFEKDEILGSLNLMGKYSFQIYFIHFIVFYFILLAYKKVSLRAAANKENEIRIMQELEDRFEQITDVEDPDCLNEH